MRNRCSDKVLNGGRRGSCGVEKDREEVINGQDLFDIFRWVFDIGSGSTTETLKKRRAMFASVDGGV